MTDLFLTFYPKNVSQNKKFYYLVLVRDDIAHLVKLNTKNNSSNPFIDIKTIKKSNLEKLKIRDETSNLKKEELNILIPLSIKIILQ